MNEKKLLILIGHYGTGKTTIALNIALDWAKKGSNGVALADLDVNNPYFRSRDWQEWLRNNKVELIIPDEQIAFAEMPFLPKQIYSLIQSSNKDLIIDLGGHDIGTKVVGSLADQIKKQPYEMWMVVNRFRPETETEEEIEQMLKRLEGLSQLKVTGLINNTNLANLTELADLVESENVVSKVAEQLNLTFIGNTVEETLVEQANKKLENKIIPIKRFDLLNW